MRIALFGVLALCAACTTTPAGAPGAPPPTAPASDAAGNRLEALVADGARFCTADGAWCAEAAGVVTHAADASTRTIEGAPEGQERAVWPFVVFVGGEADHVLMGFMDTDYDMYSGGGASSTMLTLYEMTGPATADSVLNVQIAGDAMIRACFSEADTRTRRDACHDEYAFAASLNLDPSVTSGHPRFLYASEAATYPGRVSRTADSAERGPLQARDLVWTRDETCSTTRTFTLAEARGYQPDASLPACEDYSTQ